MINIENLPPVEPEQEDEHDETSLMKEWEIYMYDFSPADLLTYEISPTEQEVFFDNGLIKYYYIN